MHEVQGGVLQLEVQTIFMTERMQWMEESFRQTTQHLSPSNRQRSSSVFPHSQPSKTEEDSGIHGSESTGTLQHAWA